MSEVAPRESMILRLFRAVAGSAYAAPVTPETPFTFDGVVRGIAVETLPCPLVVGWRGLPVYGLMAY